MNNWIEYYNHRALNSDNPFDISEMHIGNDVANQQFFADEERRMVSLFQPKADSTLIDLGCSAGICIGLLEKYFGHCIGVDLAENTLAVATERLPNAEFIHDDITKLDKLQGRTFDFVLTYGVLQFLNDEQLASYFKALPTITQKGAKVAINRMPNKFHYEAYQEYRRNRNVNRATIQSDNLVWNWISEDFIKDHTKDHFDYIGILPSSQLEMPLKAFFDCLLIRK
jgi:cyclopropane fatty-acyl-phospholipid synthase-like methyltransferase